MRLPDFIKNITQRAVDDPAPADGQNRPSVRYVFAHVALRNSTFANPEGFLSAMSESNPRREAILQDLWKQIQAQCHWDATAGRKPPSFPIRPFVLCGNCGILIELPEPQRPAEAYFSAIVVRLPDSAEPEPTAPPPTWYFTPERGTELLALFQEQGLIPKPSNRLVAALRNNPKLLISLLKETMFRGSFFRDMNEKMLPDLERDPGLRDILAALMCDPEGVVNDPARFATFLDEYERQMPTTSTVLCGWTADGSHQNFGPGSRSDEWSFLADLAVWFSARGNGDLPNGSPSG